MNESPDDIIWRVNENVKPKPLPNLTNMKHRPPELNLDPDTSNLITLIVNLAVLLLFSDY